ncbi:MAG TPA: hypothetical protein VMF33_05650 [Acidimicrobiales bacterium]|nr:hypothetical protein [Acidimicrobiales bacterium]
MPTGVDLGAANKDHAVQGVTMADKSPNQHNVKKVGKSLKEKRNLKHAKKEAKKGLSSG